jgi:two-component system response regulator PilR (NtrC family)
VDCATLEDRIAASEREWLANDDTPRDAWLREACGGTLVLDGIERLALTAQSHLGRALEEPWARPVRAEDGTARGVRLITLSREGLAPGGDAGHFLEALRYRLAGVHLHVPALRERGEDLPLLVAQLLRDLESPGNTVPSLAEAALDALAAYAYPGNVRELRWILEHALALADGGPIDAMHLPAEVVEQR